jgi:two-component sensor histidine kinase
MIEKGPARDRHAISIDARLRSLHEISMELSRSADADSLCRKAVELCVARLGFDRIGIWFLDPEDTQIVVGSWGIDEDGRARDERGIRLPRYTKNQPRELLDGSVPFVIVAGDVVFDDQLRTVGRSDKVIAPLWDGTRIGGELVADNLLSGRSISEEDGEVLWLFACTVAHLCALKRSEAALKEALKAKALLLGELQHRTMNSFAMMRSLISIEAGRAQDPTIADTLRKFRDRVTVLSSLYRQLDVSMEHEKVKLGEYLQKIAIDLLNGYGAETRDISLQCHMESIEIDIRSAIPIGLILNELITDSLKHAFPNGRRGTVTLTLRRDAEATVLVIADDGIGLPSGFALGSSKGLGLTIVNTLCGQIGGTIEVGPGPGAAFMLRLKI